MPAKPRPLSFRQIADDIAAKIHRREPGFGPGDKLPSYKELAEMYDVSVSTAQKALNLVHDRRLIEGLPGRGVYVREDLP